MVKLSASRKAKGKSAAEIEDRQFGQLRRERGLIDVPRLRRWESYNGEVEWKPGSKIKLEIYTNGAEPITLIHRARNIFNTLRDRAAEFLRLAAEEVLETFNDILNDKEAEPVDIRTFIDGVSVDAVARLVGIEGGVVSGVFHLESSGVRASDWRPRHDKRYHEA